MTECKLFCTEEIARGLGARPAVLIEDPELSHRVYAIPDGVILVTDEKNVLYLWPIIDDLI